MITGFYEHIEHTERRVIVGGLLGWVAAKGVGRALDNSIGIPGTAVSPILHPTSHIIDDIIHSPNLIIGRTIEFPRESFVALGNLTLCFVVGTHILQVRRGTPLVGNSLHTRVKGDAELKQVFSEHFIDAPPGDRLHALILVLFLDVKWKISVWINPSLFSLVLKVSQSVRSRHNDNPPRGDQACQPSTMCLSDSSLIQIPPTQNGIVDRPGIGRIGRQGDARRHLQQQGGCLRHR